MLWTVRVWGRSSLAAPQQHYTHHSRTLTRSIATQQLTPHTPVVERKWWLIDAEDMIVGRLAAQIATLLQGKHKPNYHPTKDVGDYVVVINAGKVVFTGKKWEQKVYRYHTGWPGGLKEIPVKRLLDQKPEKIIQHAVRGMLPKTTKTRAIRMKRLRVFVDDKHPHQGQTVNALVPTHISFESSRWRPTWVDPSIHRVWGFRIDDSQDPPVLVRVPSTGTKRMRRRDPARHPWTKPKKRTYTKTEKARTMEKILDLNDLPEEEFV